ncbi:DNA ligase 1-like isoform X2 [Trifolium pratense]|uniref:DNA ligase 1-like isoform X2 n=1 Tax=Trifolium pratense TaxID=57577 RepID=UPI001E692CE7|nr:DNA ligase 1-like isoform X2 [Trifolium pratense]
MFALHFKPYFSLPPLLFRISVNTSSSNLTFPLSLTPRRKMSKPPPSAFDKLMSGARAAAAKKKPPPSSSSPKKRKSPPPPPSPSPSPLSPPAQNPNNNLKTLETVETVEPPNKIRNTSSSSKGIISELKELIPQLKKKPPSFDPSSVVCWEKNKPVPFLFLCLAFDMINEESGRIVKTDIVCNLLRTVIYTTPEDLVPVVYLSANRIAPAHEGLELGIGDASIIKALAEACGRTEQQIRIQYKEKGDLGLVAKASRSSQSMMRKPEPLTIRKVFKTFHLIAKESGKDSQEKKKNHIKSLLVAATDCEPLYIIRLLQAKLRIGYAEQTLLAALGQAAVYTEEHSKPPPEIKSPFEEAAMIVKKVYSVLPDYDKIVAALLTDGVWELPKKCDFTPGVPVGPMLSKATKGVSEILNKFQDVEFTCEYKYDGERAQIHYMENGSVEIYSRNAERNTGKFPDVVAAVSRLKKPTVSSFILDCELVAYDRAKQRILPFQVLSTRARKNVAISDIKVDVCVFAFDLLHLNGQALLQENLKIRRKHLYASFEVESGFFQFATSTTSNDVEEIQKFLDQAIDASCEGLIIKTLHEDATYEPSKRSLNWLKLKKDYMDNIGDSLDLVPIGAFHGRGKRTGVYGAYLVACYDKENEEFQSIVKLATGFTEEELEERSAILRSKIIPKPKAYYKCGESINPDVWFEDSEVWEVKAADLTISPVYRAAVGIVDSNKGISLRFPRFVRVRPDKTPDQATPSEQIAEMYNKQKHNQTNNQDDDEDDD